jgi:hypothetical protein
MTTPMQLVAHETAHLDEQLAAGWSVVSAAVGPAGEAIALMTPVADAALPTGRETVSGWATFALTRTHRPWGARLVVISCGSTRVVEIEELRLAHPYVQLLPDGRFVIAGARCRFHDGIAEPNAVVLGPDGAVQSELILGDCIEDLQTSSGGSIWVSYFDEGIFSRYGWAGADTSVPIGSSGLVRFGPDGRVQWEFQPPAGHDRICDCYALNVVGETAWVYYHKDFPLVRIEAGHIRGWSTGVEGAHAVAVAGDRVLLAGGYREHAGRVLVGRLDRDSVDDLVRVVIDVPGGRSWTSMKAVGRGGTLHLCGDGRWFAADLRMLHG